MNTGTLWMGMKDERQLNESWMEWSGKWLLPAPYLPQVSPIFNILQAIGTWPNITWRNISIGWNDKVL